MCGSLSFFLTLRSPVYSTITCSFLPAHNKPFLVHMGSWLISSKFASIMSQLCFRTRAGQTLPTATSLDLQHDIYSSSYIDSISLSTLISIASPEDFSRWGGLPRMLPLFPLIASKHFLKLSQL